MTITRIRRCKPLLGTFVEVTVEGQADESTLHAWASAALEDVHIVHRLMSYQDPHSELSCLNATAHSRAMPLHPWTHRVLRCARRIGDQSRGAFDVAVRSAGGGSYRDVVLHDDGRVSFRRPLSVDLGGIAKGFAVDCAIERLRTHPLVFASVNAGGDLRVTGHAPGIIDIRDPSRPHDRFRRIPLTHVAVATSGAYFRRGDDGVLRPGLRVPAEGAGSVTVFAHTCMVADALTKVTLLADPDVTARVLAAHGAASLVLDTRHANA